MNAAIQTFDFNGACVGRVSYSTTGDLGGDGENGGLTKIVITTFQSVEIDVEVDGIRTKQPNELTLWFKGGSELLFAIEACEFLAKGLREHEFKSS